MAGCHPNLICHCAIVEKKGGQQTDSYLRSITLSNTSNTLRHSVEPGCLHSATPRTRRLLQVNGRGSTPAISSRLRIPFRVSCQVLNYSIGGMRGKMGNSGVEDAALLGSIYSIWLTGQCLSHPSNTVHEWSVRDALSKSLLG
jgi:hypothetical protein